MPCDFEGVYVRGTQPLCSISLLGQDSVYSLRMTDGEHGNGTGAPWLNEINGRDAQQLIESNATIIRVVAGPGSGKTTCLKRRIQRLVQKDKVDPETMFVGTFTRAIAKELRKALCPQVKVPTIHSFAYELLLKHPEARQGMELRFLLKYEEDALLYDIEDGASDMKDIHDRRRALRLLQSSREQLKEYSNAKFDGAVRRWLQRHKAMLIGEVIHLCVMGLGNQDISLRPFDYVMIDEYQDLTAAEQELARRIWSGSGALTVMGDNDQSIYGFRFNHPEGITNFHLDWDHCEDLTFTDNYRCGERILNVANLMMAAAGSTKPPMTSKRALVGECNLVYWGTLDEEINGLAAYIRARAEESFLVLVPRHFIGYRLAEAIGSDAKTTFDEQVLKHPIAQESFAAASLLADPEDIVATRSYLGFHGTKRENAPCRNADAYTSLPTDIGGHELIRLIANRKVDISGVGQSHIKRRAKKAIELIERYLTANEIVNLLFNEALATEERDEEKRRWLIKDLRELRGAANEILSRQNSSDLSEALATLRYRITTRASLRTSDNQKPRVRIMTLHSAKGLEADNVVIAGAAHQFMPGRKTATADIEEQRRLLYVAITRARNSLIISWPRRILLADMRKQMGQTNTVRTYDGATWVITSRSSLLPQGVTGEISGSQLLASIPPEGTA